MLQWCYAFVTKNCPDGARQYDALDRRLHAVARQRHTSRRSAHGGGRGGGGGGGGPVHSPSAHQQDQLPNDVRGPKTPTCCQGCSGLGLGLP